MLIIKNIEDLNKYKKIVNPYENNNQEYCYSFDEDNVTIDIPINLLEEKDLAYYNFYGKNITFKHYSKINKIILSGNLVCTQLMVNDAKIDGNIYGKEIYCNNLQCNCLQCNYINCKVINSQYNINCNTLICEDLLMYKNFKIKELIYKGNMLFNISSRL